jgi:hypothetical protein
MRIITVDKTTLRFSRNWTPIIQWSGLGGVLGPVLFILLFTVAGFLRPGYSALSQTVSDLGVGSLAWLVDIPIVILDLLLIMLAVSFFGAVRQALSAGWR